MKLQTRTNTHTHTLNLGEKINSRTHSTPPAAPCPPHQPVPLLIRGCQNKGLTQGKIIVTATLALGMRVGLEVWVCVGGVCVYGRLGADGATQMDE